MSAAAAGVLALAGLPALRAQEPVLRTQAPDFRPQEPIGDNPAILKGRMENGLTYYLCRHALPKSSAEFFIVHHVGALQEEDGQSGLAHFLEHMAFNGTTHYPDKTILQFLEKEGVRFGYNVNAYTSRTETVYHISSVPLVRDSFIDSVLMVLHDWSCAISCEQEALDAERGVISEEWRRRDDARSRMAAQQYALCYHGARHVRRPVLGTLEVINGFRRDEILEFYRKWYRPDLQALIVVGDFEVAGMEKRLLRLFSDIPAPVRPAAKEACPIPPLREPLCESMTDPRIKYYTFKAIHRQPFPGEAARGTAGFFKDAVARQLVSGIVEARFREAVRAEGCPVRSAVLVTSPLSTDFYQSLFTLSPKSKTLLEETAAFYAREMRRILQFGLIPEECDRARAAVARKLGLDKEAGAVTNAEIVTACKENFLRKTPCLFPSEVRQWQKKALESLTFEEIQAYLHRMFGDSEKIYSFSLNSAETDLLPSKERLLQLMAEVGEERLEPHFPEYKSLDMDFHPVPGRIRRARPLRGGRAGEGYRRLPRGFRTKQAFPLEKWELDNGIDLFYLPFEDTAGTQGIALSFFTPQGYADFPAARKRTAALAGNFIERNLGFSNMDRTELAACASMKGLRQSFRIRRNYTEYRLTAGGEDREKAFKTLYLQLMRPNFSDRRTLDGFKADRLADLRKTPGSGSLFREEKREARYGKDPWSGEAGAEEIHALDTAVLKALFAHSVSGGGKRTVFLSTAMERERVKTLVCKYIASLPPVTGGVSRPVSSAVRPEADQDGADTRAGTVLVPNYSGRTVLEREYPAASEPKTEVEIFFKGRVKPSRRNESALAVMDYILSARCHDRLREERGGTYNVSCVSERLADGAAGAYPGDGAGVESVIAFKSRPALTPTLIADALQIVDAFCKDGPTEEELQTATAYFRKTWLQKEETRRESPESRMTRCSDGLLFGRTEDPDYLGTLGGLTVRQIRKAARQIRKGDRLIAVYREQ